MNPIPISQVIKKRIADFNAMKRYTAASYFANDNIAEFIKDGELDSLLAEVEERVESLLESLIIDTSKDHNTQQTAHRIAKMYIQEVFSGRYQEKPILTEFPNARELDEIYLVGPVALRSTCSHHFVPIIGQCWLVVLPSEKVIGLSKFNRLVNWVASRPHIQEEFSVILADEIEKAINPAGLLLVVRAQHLCMSWRGVKDNDTVMINSIVRGRMKESLTLKQEALLLVNGAGFLN